MRLNVPLHEIAGFRGLLARHAHRASEYEVHEEEFSPNFGPSTRLLFVSGPTSATYSRADGEWLTQLEKDLKAGLFGHPE